MRLEEEPPERVVTGRGMVYSIGWTWVRGFGVYTHLFAIPPSLFCFFSFPFFCAFGGYFYQFPLSQVYSLYFTFFSSQFLFVLERVKLLFLVFALYYNCYTLHHIIISLAL